MDIYHKKYLKYKSKYIELRDEISGGGKRQILFFIPKNGEDQEYKAFITKLKTDTIFYLADFKKYMPNNGLYEKKILAIDGAKIKLNIDINNNNFTEINTQIRNNLNLKKIKYLILETQPGNSHKNYKILYIDPQLISDIPHSILSK